MEAEVAYICDHAPRSAVLPHFYNCHRDRTLNEVKG